MGAKIKTRQHDKATHTSNKFVCYATKNGHRRKYRERKSKHVNTIKPHTHQINLYVMVQRMDTDVNTGPTIGKRHVQVLLLFICLALEYASRENLSLAIVAMTNNQTSSNTTFPTYNWNNTHTILSSFYWGFVLLQVFGGQMSRKFGPKFILFFGSIFNSFATTFTPQFAAWFGSGGVMACRIVQGLCQGMFFPATHTMLGKWAPKKERARLTTMVYMGVGIGCIIATPIGGHLCASKLGWPTTFYFFGGLEFVWCGAWVIFGFNSPAQHPRINFFERRYIEQSLEMKESKEDMPTPWRHILTSKHVWAIIVAMIGVDWGSIFLMTEIPSYLFKVMKYDIAQAGWMTAIPSVAGTVCQFAYGFIADYIIAANWVTTVRARKLFHLFACYTQAFTMLCLAYISSAQAYLSVFLLTLANVASAAVLQGCTINSVDISPRFSGIILAIANTSSSCIAMFAPLVVQFIVKDEENPVQWRTTFIIAALFYIIPATIFGFFASGEKQWWNSGAAVTKKDKKVEK